VRKQPGHSRRQSDGACADVICRLKLAERGMCCSGLSLEDNKRRPGRYILLQEEEQRVFGTVEDSLTAGYAFKERFGNRRCQDVLLEEGERHASLTPVNSAVCRLRAPRVTHGYAAQINAISEVQRAMTQRHRHACFRLWQLTLPQVMFFSDEALSATGRAEGQNYIHFLKGHGSSCIMNAGCFSYRALT